MIFYSIKLNWYLILNDFDYFKKIVKDTLGVDLDMSDPDRNFTKMEKFCKEMGVTIGFRKYHLSLVDEEEISIFKKRLINVITINETSFFRDKIPFDYLKDYINGMKNISALSIPSSTGQEAYSLAMLFEESKILQYSVIGFDICEEVVEYANKGIYSSFEVKRGLDSEYLLRYFEQLANKYEISDKLKYHVKFFQSNILNPTIDLKKYDIILCRNLLIYFNDKTRVEVLENIVAHMLTGGKLMLGAGERVEHPSLQVEYFNGMAVYTKMLIK